jgi:hypothetical protein
MPSSEPTLSVAEFACLIALAVIWHFFKGPLIERA